MTLYRITAPNGVTYQTEGPPGATPEQVRAVILKAHPEAGKPVETSEEKPGTALGRGISRSVDITQQGLGSALEGIGRVTGFEGLEKYGADVAARNTQELEEAEKYATRRQDVEGIGTGLSYAGETLGESAVPMGIGIIADAAAGAVAGSVVPGLGTLAGMGIGAGVGALTQLPLFYGWNRERQKDAVQQGIKPEVSEGAAFLTAIPQAALEGIANRLLLGTGKLLVKPGSGLFTGLAKGATAGVVTEVPTEIGQQVLERAQAGLPLDDDEAMQEYTDAAVGAGLIGGGIGGISGGIKGRRGAAEKPKTEEGFGEGETPPPSAPQVDAEFNPEEATEDELRAKLASDPVAVEEFGRTRAYGLSAPMAFDAAYRRSIERNAAPRPGTEAPSEPTTTDTGEAGEPRVRGREPSVPPADGKTSAAIPAAATAGLGGEGLGGVGEPAASVRGGEAGKPGALDQYLPPGFEALTPEEQAQELRYAQEMQRADETVAGPALEPVAAPPTLAPTLTLDPKTPRKERTAQAIEAVKAVAGTHEDFAGLVIDNKAVNKAAQRLVNNNGGDPLASLSRVLEETPAKPKKGKVKAAEEIPFEGVSKVQAAPEVQAAPTIPAAPEVQVAPEVQAAPAIPAAPEVQAASTTPTAPKVEAAPDLFSRDINPEAIPYTRAEEVKETVPPEMTAFPETPKRAPAPYIEPTPTLEPAKKTKKDKGRVYTVEPARTANYPQVMVLARTALREKHLTQDDFDLVKKQAEEESVAPQNLGGMVNALIAASKERKSRGPQGVTAETAAAMGDRTYRQLQRTEGTEAAEGMYSPLEKLIRVALDANNQLKTLHHEAIHAIRGMGLFKDSEWALLSDKAKNEWLTKYKIAETYAGDNLTEEQMVEEAVAEAFADYMANRNQGGKIKYLFDKLRKFLQALVGAVRPSAEGVFGAVESGEVGRRERRPAVGETAEAPTVRGRMSYTPERNAERARVGAELRKNLDALGLKDVALKVPDAMRVERGEKTVSLQRKAEEEISRGQAKYQQSKNAEQAVSGLGQAVKGHFAKAYEDSMYSLGLRGTKTATKFLPTSSLIHILERMDKQAGENGNSIINAADASTDAKANLNAGLYNLVKPVIKFVKKNGYDTLANMQSIARLYKVNVVASPDVASALAGDQVMQGYDKLIAGTTNSREIADYTEGRNRRAAEITEAYKLWDELGKLEGAREAYKILRQFYQDAYNLRRAARDKLFDTLAAGDPATRAKLEKLRADHFEKIKTAPDPNYHNIERSLTPEEYSPFMRFGDYWLRVTKGANGEPEYYHFEDATTRRRFLQERAAELGVSPDDAEMFSTGKLDTEQGRAEFLSSDAALREMFNTIDRILPGDENEVLRQSLKNDAYQARLDALPESDMRQHFKHAKERTGWAPDPLRVFGSYATSFVNDMVNLEYKPKYDAAVSQARDLLKSMPLGDKKDKIVEYMNAVIAQGDSAFRPPNTNDLATSMNRAGFIYYLSGGATAMAQFISVPGRVVPAIGSVYGYDTAVKLFGKYNKFAFRGKSVTTTLPDGSKEWSYPGLDKAPEVKNNPRLLAAFKSLYEMGAFRTPTATITELKDTPASAIDAVDHKVKTALLQTSTALFNGAELISRQMSAMMRYEAAYDARIKKGMDSKQANKEALQEAVKETERALGNYRETERPAIMKGPIARMVFLFKMYPVNVTKFFLENGYAMLKDKDPEVRRRAFKELAGVVAIGGMFHGLKGMFGYSVITTAIGMLLDQLEDDEDKRRRIEEDPVFADDYDGYFFYRWLPEHFGEVGAKVLEVGPLAALTPLNFASRTSYNDLWLREGLTGSTWMESVKNLILANIGPAVSMGGSLDLAAKDFNDGEVMRGIERMMPALVRGPLMAYRLGTEGAETRGGDKIVSPGEISEMQLVGAALGLSPRQVAEYQNKRIAALNFQARLSGDKAAALRAVNKPMFEENYDAVGKAMEGIQEFNAKYPSKYFIDDDTREKSYEAYKEKREKTRRGVSMEDDEIDFYDFLIRGGGL
jgi:soluble cytochrome b562